MAQAGRSVGNAGVARRARLRAVAARLGGFGPVAGAALGLAVVVASAYKAVDLRFPIGPSFAVFGSLEVAYLGLLTALWMHYHPVLPPPESALPRLSVIIPAFNEGPMVERSIRSVAEARYPRDRLEIIVIDDGSRDDTFFHIQKIRRTHPDLVRVIHFPGNQGKRAALRAGFLAASGEVVLTIDSDSEVDAETLRAMVAPFADPRVGAVAGRVAVLNRHTFIGRMLDVQFTLSFDFVRAAQSTYGTVMVCPGALSAFRRLVILPHLDGWVAQRFLGRLVGHGEDQALTNIVLRSGYDTRYQSNAVVRTLVPDRYRQLSRMLVRWDRSFLVEGFAFARFMFRRCRPRSRLLPIVAFLFSSLRPLMLLVALSQLPRFFVAGPHQLVTALVAVAVAAIGSALYYLRTDRGPRFLYGLAYPFYSLLLLQWILPWALFTIRDERWGTR
jgi:hyaluronan synthase